jgi:hypothetical protein
MQIDKDNVRKLVILKTAEHKWAEELAANLNLILAPQQAFKLAKLRQSKDYYKFGTNLKHARLYKPASSVADAICRVICFALDNPPIHQHNLTKQYRAFRYNWKYKHVVEYQRVKFYMPKQQYLAVMREARQRHIQFNTLVAYWVFSARIQNPDADPYVYLEYGTNPLKLADLQPNFAELEVNNGRNV